MQPDSVDYGLLATHICHHCEAPHRLDVLPDKAGWVVGVRCRCARNGHPIRYSTETFPFPTFLDAGEALKALLDPAGAVA